MNPDRLFWRHRRSKIRCIFRIQKKLCILSGSHWGFFPFLNNEWSCFNVVLMLGVLGEEIQLKACHRTLLFHWQELSCSCDTWCAEHQLINSLKMKLSVSITSQQQLPGTVGWGAGSETHRSSRWRGRVGVRGCNISSPEGPEQQLHSLVQRDSSQVCW